MDVKERQYYFYQINGLRPYLISAWKRLGEWHCWMCNGIAQEIDHLRYSENITIKDLMPLCKPCHANKTGIANDLRLSGDYCSHCQRSY